MHKTQIGGPLGVAELGRLLGDRPGHERDHARPHDLALEHARDHLRRACSALAAAQPPDAVQAAELARMHARLADELVALERVVRRL